ncbi:hypothetical protein N836_00290 [Leptolyngbya sp. Heron Island J]|uniref:hypothetical protein n=1 Tax=Leptolyngbya sp. Heron Island J TaxID=1385935 RepID=UPI0003B98620|nr:hypothetical protein [Leptolyngbya sp. Heron Island J]ESA37151.1 hypothetical protein N836_00290 [Leptolyngbya sp. Heron Island J]
MVSQEFQPLLSSPVSDNLFVTLTAPVVSENLLNTPQLAAILQAPDVPQPSSQLAKISPLQFIPESSEQQSQNQ